MQRWMWGFRWKSVYWTARPQLSLVFRSVHGLPRALRRGGWRAPGRGHRAAQREGPLCTGRVSPATGAQAHRRPALSEPAARSYWEAWNRKERAKPTDGNWSKLGRRRAQHPLPCSSLDVGVCDLVLNGNKNPVTLGTHSTCMSFLATGIVLFGKPFCKNRQN